MSTARMEAVVADLSKKVSSLMAGVTAQSALIETQNKKIEDQQKIIEKYFSTICDLKRVIQEMPAKLIDLLSASQPKSEIEVPTAIPTATSASETRILSQSNMSQRALRAIRRADKATSTVSNNCAKSVGSDDIEILGDNESEKWNLVGGPKKNKKNHLKAVHTGGNNQIDLFQAVQKKKFLHVWSLHLETSEKSIAEHVKKICDSEDFKVEKIIPKTKRDYSSFMIGVPESSYDKLNSADNWPVNAKFSEWVWFRNFRKSAKDNESHS